MALTRTPSTLGALSAPTIVFGIVVAVVLMIGAVLLHRYPPTKTATVFSMLDRTQPPPAGYQGREPLYKHTVDPIDSSLLVMGMFGGAMALLFWSLNGRQFTKFSSGGIVLDTSPEQSAREIFSDKAIVAKIPPSNSGSPFTTSVAASPHTAPRITLKAGNQRLEVFDPFDVPPAVVLAALTQWPATALPRPRSARELEFGALHAGSSDPWLLRFHTGLVSVTADPAGAFNVKLIA